MKQMTTESNTYQSLENYTNYRNQLIQLLVIDHFLVKKLKNELSYQQLQYDLSEISSDLRDWFEKNKNMIRDSSLSAVYDDFTDVESLTKHFYDCEKDPTNLFSMQSVKRLLLIMKVKALLKIQKQITLRNNNHNYRFLYYLFNQSHDVNLKENQVTVSRKVIDHEKNN